MNTNLSGYIKKVRLHCIFWTLIWSYINIWLVSNSKAVKCSLKRALDTYEFSRNAIFGSTDAKFANLGKIFLEREPKEKNSYNLLIYTHKMKNVEKTLIWINSLNIISKLKKVPIRTLKHNFAKKAGCCEVSASAFFMFLLYQTFCF